MPAPKEAWVRSVCLSKIIATRPRTGQRLGVVRRVLECGREVEDRGLLGRGEVVVRQEVPHHCTPIASSRIAGHAARNALASSSVSTSGGASRIRDGVGLLMMKPADCAAAGTSADASVATGRGR